MTDIYLFSRKRTKKLAPGSSATLPKKPTMSKSTPGKFLVSLTKPCWVIETVRLLVCPDWLEACWIEVRCVCGVKCLKSEAQRGKRGATVRDFQLHFTCSTWFLLPQIFLNWAKHQHYQDSQKLPPEFKVSLRFYSDAAFILYPIRFVSFSSSEIHTSCLSEAKCVPLRYHLSVT